MTVPDGVFAGAWVFGFTNSSANAPIGEVALSVLEPPGPAAAATRFLYACQPMITAAMTAAYIHHRLGNRGVGQRAAATASGLGLNMMRV